MKVNRNPDKNKRLLSWNCHATLRTTSVNRTGAEGGYEARRLLVTYMSSPSSSDLSFLPRLSFPPSRTEPRVARRTTKVRGPSTAPGTGLGPPLSGTGQRIVGSGRRPSWGPFRQVPFYFYRCACLRFAFVRTEGRPTPPWSPGTVCRGCGLRNLFVDPRGRYLPQSEGRVGTSCHPCGTSGVRR